MRRLSRRETIYIKCLLAAILLFSLYLFVQRTIILNLGRTENDFYVYYAAAHQYARGGEFYNPPPYPLTQQNPLESVEIEGGDTAHKYRPYIYLPFLAWLLQPLTYLPYKWVEAGWTGLLFLAYWFAVCLFLWQFWRRNELKIWEITAFTLIAAWWIPTFTAFLAGQITPIIFLLFVFHFWLAEEKQDTISGFVLGLAILFKLSPIVFLILWVLQRRWRIAVGAVMTLTIGIGVASVDKSIYFLTNIFPHLMLGENDVVNFSLTGFTHRWVFGQPWGWLSAEQVQQNWAYLLFMKLLMALLWGITLWGTWRKTDPQGKRLIFVSFLAAMVLFSPVTRHYDFIYVFLCVVYLYLDYKQSRNLVLGYVLGFCVILNMVNIPIWFASWSAIPLLGEIVSKPASLAVLLLWIISLVERYRKRKNVK
ncbi:DUF2029 domain-containing protein [bacterium]|nr:DUF2029 domain-containing protein [bacterium]